MVNIATSISAGLLIIAVVAAAASPWLDVQNHRFSLTDDLHIGVGGRGWDVKLFFYNDRNGPYLGSVVGVVDDSGVAFPNLERELHFGPALGIYLRYFRWPDAVLWTLAVSLWYCAAALAILPAWRWVRRTSLSFRRLDDQ